MDAGAKPAEDLPKADGDGAGDFIQILGQFLFAPRRALEEISAKPDLSQAVLVALLSLLSLSQSVLLKSGGSGLLSNPVGALAFLFIGGLFAWGALTGMWHTLSQFLNRPGRYKIFLCLTGWSMVLFWLMLPLAHLASLLPSLLWLFRAISLLLVAVYLDLVSASLRMTYGWSEKGALGVLFLPVLLLLLPFLLMSAVLLFMGGAVLSKVFL